VTTIETLQADSRKYLKYRTDPSCRIPRIRKEIFPVLKKAGATHCPFTNLPEKRTSRWGEALTAEKMKECRWVKPKLVCQIAFVEWTDAGHLKHCTFIGMRNERDARKAARSSESSEQDG
jgi:hypothetical protein